MKPTRFGVSVGSVLAAAIVPAVFLAQARGQAEPREARGVDAGINADSFYGKEPTDGVYVRDSAAAVEKLTLARKMEHLKEWNKSADLYQEVLVKYADRVVPSQLDNDKKIYQYTSITNPVQEQLAHWPVEGLDIYRARFESLAQTLLDAAGPNDAIALNKICLLYFVTEAGKQAAIRLVDLYLENGEFPAAAWLGDRLLTLHPTLEPDRAAVLYRTALAYYYSGDAAKAHVRLDSLKTHFPADRGTIRGREVLLADSLATELKASVANSMSASADSWPTPWGDATRSRVSTAEGRPGARLYGITLSKPIWSNGPAARDAAQKQYEERINEGDTLGIMPVTDRGEMFFQDGLRIYGVSVESGAPLPGWSQSYPDGRYVLPNASGSGRGHQLTVTLTEHDLLAIMGQPDAFAIFAGGVVTPPMEPKIICLDRETGRPRWETTLSQLPESAKEARALHISGSPMVVGDSVLVIAHGVKTQFEECHVLAFELATGKYRWSTFIASAGAGGMVWNGNGAVAREGDNTSHMAYANGRVYVQTNLGALAALDAYSGSVVWLDIYPTGRQLNERAAFNPFMQANPASGPAHKPWTFNPVMISDGDVFTLPGEGNHLLIYDAATGVEIKRMDLKRIEQNSSVEGSSTSPFDTLVGISGDFIVLASEKQLDCINWRQYTDEAFNPTRDNITKWIWDAPGPLRGRPFMMKDTIYLACRDRMFRLGIKLGRALDVYPPNGPGNEGNWELPEEPGNILATNDHVIVAGARSINVYTDLTLAKAKLDKELALAPNDALPRLKYAEIMFVAGESDSAMTKLTETVELLGGIKSLQVGVNRDRLFTDALTFAEKLSRVTSAEETAHATALYDLAGSAASSPVQQVRYRLSRAKFAASSKDFTAAIALYQEILADPQMRPIPQPNENSPTPLQAGGAAEAAIAEIMKDRPGAYESFQQAAASAMEQALAQKENAAPALLEIARTYPNSTVAGKAMIAAAEAFENANGSRQAIRVLRDLWFKHPDSPDKARILESIARNYLAMAALPRGSASDRGPMDNMDAAAAALARAASLPGEPKLEKPLTLRDGTIVDAGTPIARALELVRKYRGQEVSRALPEFQIPVPPPHGSGQPWPKPFLPAYKARDTIANIKSLVLPLRDFSRSDRVVAFAGDGALAIFEAGQIKPLTTVPGMAEEPKNCAWLGKSLLVWGNSIVTCITPENGAQSWKIDLRQVAPIDVIRVGENSQVADANPNAPQNNPNVIQLNNGQQVIVHNNQRIILQPGNVVPAVAPVQAVAAVQARPAGGTSEEIVDVLPVGDHLLLTTTSGRIVSADLANGNIAWQTRLTDRPVDRLVANDDFTAVKVTDDNAVRIAAFDTATGQIRCTRSWAVQTGIAPINLALAADGTLVYTMPDRLCLKDLYKPWPDASDKEMQANQGLQLFEKSRQPDQLLIAEGRILALADSGTIKYVRVHSLETGQPLSLRYHSAQGDQDVDRVLEVGKSDQVALRVVGSHLYVINSTGVTSYNLDRPAESWKMQNDPMDTDFFPGYVRDSFIAKKFLVLLCEPPAVATAAAAPVPVVAPPAPGVGANGVRPNAQAAVLDPNGAASTAAHMCLQIFGIYPTSAKNPAESGRLGYRETVSDAAGITSQWQASDGGFYYLTADSTLHVLRGSESAK